MKSIIRELVWKAYYYIDYLKCRPHFSEVMQVDDALCSEMVERLQNINCIGSALIIATHNKLRQSNYINYLISKLNDRPVIVVNNTSTGHYKSEMIGDNVVWVDRPNYLRDIGAYRLAVKAICQLQNEELNRVVLMNDSFYVLREDFFKHISHPFEEDVVSHSFSEYPTPHFRSYWLSLKPKLLPALNEYLQKIPLTRSRYAAIRMGELGMSRCVFLNYVCNVLPIADRVCEQNSVAYSNILRLDEARVWSQPCFTTAINKLHYHNESLDPYEMSKASESFVPAIIKREVYEKGLANKVQCLFWIKSSDIPERMHNEIAKEVLINTRPRTFINLFKRNIGEI